MEFSTKGGSGWVDFPLRKKEEKNAKMIRMVQFIQKTEDLNFVSLGVSGHIFGLIVRFNNAHLTPASQEERWIKKKSKIIQFLLCLYYLYNHQIWREL